MSEAKKSKKRAGKDSQLAIRINTSDRDTFVALCNDLDTSAAREIRRFIRGFVATHAKTVEWSEEQCRTWATG